MPTDQTPGSSPAAPPWDGDGDDDPEIARVLALLEARMLGVTGDKALRGEDERESNVSAAPDRRPRP